jgi:hypothetical protein
MIGGTAALKDGERRTTESRPPRLPEGRQRPLLKKLVILNGRRRSPGREAGQTDKIKSKGSFLN